MTDEPIDAAIGECLLAGGDAESLRRLSGLGPAAVVRWVEVFTGRGRPFVRPAGITLSGREEVDAWSVMLGELAQAHPEEFLDAVDSGALGRRTDTLILVCLRSIPTGARPLAILADGLASRDPLERLHAARALRERTDARNVLVHAYNDPDEAVRWEVHQGLAHYDPDIARDVHAARPGRQERGVANDDDW